jgi:NTE family protein
VKKHHEKTDSLLYNDGTMKITLKKKKIGLALGGGAARGYAHIGVLKVLEEKGISFDYVTGTSVGSMIGALICGGFGWEEILDIARKLSWKELARPTLSGLGLVSTEKLEKFIIRLLGDLDFDELDIPFGVVAVDIASAREVVFDRGSVARAVRASCSIPGIFEPVIEDDMALVDGGVINNLPSSLVRDMGAERVIAVDLNASRSEHKMPVNLLDISYRSFAMLLDSSSADGRDDADFLIQPDLKNFSYHDLSQADELFERGVEAAEKTLSRFARL